MGHPSSGDKEPGQGFTGVEWAQGYEQRTSHDRSGQDVWVTVGKLTIPSLEEGTRSATRCASL